jgi:hypothetical protein
MVWGQSWKFHECPEELIDELHEGLGIDMQRHWPTLQAAFRFYVRSFFRNGCSEVAYAWTASGKPTMEEASLSFSGQFCDVECQAECLSQHIATVDFDMDVGLLPVSEWLDFDYRRDGGRDHPVFTRIVRDRLLVAPSGVQDRVRCVTLCLGAQAADRHALAQGQIPALPEWYDPIRRVNNTPTLVLGKLFGEAHRTGGDFQSCSGWYTEEMVISLSPATGHAIRMASTLYPFVMAILVNPVPQRMLLDAGIITAQRR